MDTELSLRLRCIVGLSTAIWLASVFGEPSCMNESALGMVLLGSLLIGASGGLMAKHRPHSIALHPNDATVGGVALAAFASVLASTSRIMTGLPPMDMAVSFASFTLGVVFIAVAMAEEKTPLPELPQSVSALCEGEASLALESAPFLEAPHPGARPGTRNGRHVELNGG